MPDPARYRVSLDDGIEVEASNDQEAVASALAALAEDPSLLEANRIARCGRCGRDYLFKYQEGHDLYCEPEMVGES